MKKLWSLFLLTALVTPCYSNEIELELRCHNQNPKEFVWVQAGSGLNWGLGKGAMRVKMIASQNDVIVFKHICKVGGSVRKDKFPILPKKILITNCCPAIDYLPMY